MPNVADRTLADAIEDPFLRRSVKTALHLRRYLPFYVFGTLWALTLAAFPIINNNDSTTGSDQQAGSVTAADGTTSDGALADNGALADTGAATDTGTAASSGGAAATGGTGTAARKAVSSAASPASGGGGAQTGGPVSAAEASSAVQRGTGTTRLGIPCNAETNQIPGSTYAIPCQNVYDGPNGGATYRGVTDKEIVIVDRQFPESPNGRAVAEVSKQAGFADPEVTKAVRKEFIAYFNKAYELYGRQVKWVDYEAKNGDGTNEAQSKGKEEACLDADEVVKEIKAFAVDSGSQPFSDCASERKMLVFNASAYFPEKHYLQYHPYQWNITMDCERIAYQVAEYMGKRLINKPAKFAGDATLKAKPRLFGTYVPDNDGYQYCVSTYKRELKEKYGYTVGPQYNYQLDVSRFPDQAAQASVQFAAAGVTSVVLACDFISATVLTAAATQQQWHPEWFSIGVGGTDLDNTARLYDQQQANGHLFGMSQLGDAVQLIGPKSEPGTVYKIATGKTLPEGTNGAYHSLVHMFNLLQAAGPILTPETIAKGVLTIPVRGAEPFPAGRWSYVDKPTAEPGGDHTAVQDAREVYWVSEPGTDTASGAAARDEYYNGPDGKNGTFKVTYNGRRFLSGEWEKTDPPVYPPR
jgi:hypothetical protein